MGYDSDAHEAEGEVGRVGVPISSLADMAILLDGLPLDKVSTSMTINATAPILLALYVAAAEAQGVARGAIGGTTQNDILKEYIARGTYIFPPRPSMRLVTDVFEFCATELPKWNTISISGYHMREAGATAAQELAFTLADAIAYVDAAVARGLDVDDFAGRLSFFFAAWSELFEEVAKFRVARRMWATIMKERFGAKDPRSLVCRFHVQTAGSSLTAQSIDNNVVRTTIQALAAILGGAQSLHTNSRDEALALPTEEAARLALRTQQILAHEAGVTETPDPLAGSYYVESLTNELEAAAWAYLDEIESMGGTLAAIEHGFQQRQIQESAYRVQRAIESGDQVVVGVNRFRDDELRTPPLHKIDPDGERRQVERVHRVRAERSADAWTVAMDEVERVARADGNLMPAILVAARAYATVGEISDRLRLAWGEHRELITV
jgi:methylmalonyl-CoA mutase N-terminal domain/subunit